MPERSGDIAVWQLTCVVAVMAAVTAAAICEIAQMRPSAPPRAAILEAKSAATPANMTVAVKSPVMPPRARAALSPNVLVATAFSAIAGRFAPADVTGALAPDQTPAYADDDTAATAVVAKQESLQDGGAPQPAIADPAIVAARRELPYLKYSVYSELPPPKKPADIVLEALSDVPLGTPVEEIKRAADAFDLDVNFMKAVAKIESDFDPNQRTGSYIGLFQLSKYEFAKFGSGEITNARDNAIAAADKFVYEAAMFEYMTHKKPTFSDLYLIHQQGWQGAAEHVNHPDWVAWKSMCATDEGAQKGERWCKRAIWENTLPAVKHEWKSVDRLTSSAFVAMWRDRVDTLYARYSTPPVVQAQQ